MTLTDEIAEARATLDAAVDAVFVVLEDEPVARFVLYQVARDRLAGRIQEIVWTEPPFPEGDDQEAKP